MNKSGQVFLKDYETGCISVSQVFRENKMKKTRAYGSSMLA